MSGLDVDISKIRTPSGLTLIANHSGWVICQVKITIQVQIEPLFCKIKGKTDIILLILGKRKGAANDDMIPKIRLLLEENFPVFKGDINTQGESVLME